MENFSNNDFNKLTQKVRDKIEKQDIEDLTFQGKSPDDLLNYKHQKALDTEKQIQFWGKEHEPEELLDKLNRVNFSLGFNDYSYKADRVARNLQIYLYAQNDPLYQKLFIFADGNEENFLLQLRIREIILSKLSDVAASLPVVTYEGGIGDYSEMPGTGTVNWGDSHLEPKKIFELVKMLIYTTKGLGTKMFSLGDVSAFSGKELAVALELEGKTLINHQSIEEIAMSLRGVDLVKFLKDQLDNNKTELLEKAKKMTNGQQILAKEYDLFETK